MNTDMKIDNSKLGYYFAIPIAILYGVFFTKLINVLMKYENKTKMCDGIQKYESSSVTRVKNDNGYHLMTSPQTSEYKLCIDEKKKLWIN
jgi:hypothetical protein